MLCECHLNKKKNSTQRQKIFEKLISFFYKRTLRNSSRIIIYPDHRNQFESAVLREMSDINKEVVGQLNCHWILKYHSESKNCTSSELFVLTVINYMAWFPRSIVEVDISSFLFKVPREKVFVTFVGIF